MIDFLVGGLYTLVIISLAFGLGYVVGGHREEAVVGEFKSKIKRLRSKQVSGPLKPYTKQERELDESKVMGDLIERLHE